MHSKLRVWKYERGNKKLIWRTENTIVKRKKGQSTIYKTLHKTKDRVTVQCLSQNKLDKKILFQFERWLAKNHGKEYKILWGWKNFFLTKGKDPW
jgi:hypothetical protein